MTTEGSFPLGGAVAVTLIVHGVDPLIATLAAFFSRLFGWISHWFALCQW